MEDYNKGIIYMLNRDLRKQMEILKKVGEPCNSDTITKLLRIYLKYDIDQHLSFNTVEECASFAVNMLNSKCNGDNSREKLQKVKEYLGGCFYGKCLVDNDMHDNIVSCGKRLRTGTLRFQENSERCDVLPDATSCNANNKCEWKNGACVRKKIYPLFSRFPPL